MKTRSFAFVFALLALTQLSLAQTDLRLWFDTPATNFTQSLPLGNGRLGAMVFGGVNEERIVLNESSLWSGGPQDADRSDAAQYLPEIKRLLLEGKNDEAEKLVYAHFTCQSKGSNRARGKDEPYGSYQVLGNLHLNFPGKTTEATDYKRELNLSDATARVSYEQGGVLFTREVFVSASDEAIIIRLTANKPGAIHFSAALDRPERFATVADGNNGLLMSGQLNNGTDGKGMKYVARLHVQASGGATNVDGNSVRVTNANEAIIFITAATNFRGFAGRQTANELAASANDLQKATAKNFSSLLAAHKSDYEKYFNRVRLTLPTNNETATLPTPARLRAVANGANDPALAALYFQFGRYLLISSSRPGGLPANLQGIWAEEVQAPWNADWHLNINVQMNYWLAENTNLSELHEPLFALIASLQKPGERTAKLYYNARGWVAHVITNLWGFTAPGEGANWGSTSTGAAWLCQHLWDHYLFTRDKEFLKRAYPVMKGSARFYADMLIEEPKNKWLVTALGNSPENAFQMPNGKTAHVAMGPTIDQQLLRYLFDACIEASKTLNTDAEFRKELSEKRARLAPTRIGGDGRVMEWLEEYSEPEPTHRHVSHLWGLYPGAEITPEATPTLAAGARKTLEGRGDISTGWSLAHKLNFWARLGDGNRCNKLLTLLLTPVGFRKEVEGVRFQGGSYDNLFDAHPPFQIDGNFGAAAGIAEMLVQSHNAAIRLLPALPDAWIEGRVTGLRARGGFEIDVVWKHGQLTSATIRSLLGESITIRYGGKELKLKTSKGQSYKLNAELKSTR
ncbi:MAG: glycoside hydrolase family 95 protein [Blastocatellia bacterium]|nr:glycoside hydrolase family 95 protein [Blastocatellia bacterium]